MEVLEVVSLSIYFTVANFPRKQNELMQTLDGVQVPHSPIAMILNKVQEKAKSRNMNAQIYMARQDCL